MGIEIARGIVLNRINYSDTSLIAVILTPEEGVMRFMGKGFRKPPKRSYSSRDPIETFSELEITYFRSSGDMHYLRESVIIDPFWGIRNDYQRLEAAAFGAGLILDMSSQGSEEEFLGLRSFFRRLSGNAGISTSVMRFWVRLLYSAGFLPDTESCSICSTPFGGSAIGFSPGRGFLCNKCVSKYGRTHSELTPGDLKYIGLLLENNDPRGKVKMSQKVMSTIISTLTAITAHEVGRPPRLLDRIRKICDNSPVHAN